MLIFVGLGLYDEKDISLRGLEAVRLADAVYLESYTSRLTGTDQKGLETLYGKVVIPLTREEVEVDPWWLDRAREETVAFLVGGDPMISTTHLDLRLRAEEMGIPTSLIHASNIASAVPGITGLQNYRFGRSTSLPFPYTVRHKRIVPDSPYLLLKENMGRDLHTLFYLDIQDDRNMTGSQAAELLQEMAETKGDKGLSQALGVVVARAGAPDCLVRADSLSRLKDLDFGPPLHILVIPARLHFMEARALKQLAQAPEELVEGYQL